VVVVCAGGDVVAGAGVVAAVVRGAVVTTPAWVVGTGAPATVVVGPAGADEEVDVAFEVVVARELVDVGRSVVVGDWVATCCLGDESSPVATSNSMAASATAARAYSPTLNR
jgi:hypothetical protein